MVVSVDLPESLVDKLDGLIARPKEPPWPFPERKPFRVEALPAPERERWSEYLKAMAEFESSKLGTDSPRTRSAALRMIVQKFFADGGVPVSPPVVVKPKPIYRVGPDAATKKEPVQAAKY